MVALAAPNHRRQEPDRSSWCMRRWELRVIVVAGILCSFTATSGPEDYFQFSNEQPILSVLAVSRVKDASTLALHPYFLNGQWNGQCKCVKMDFKFQGNILPVYPFRYGTPTLRCILHSLSILKAVIRSFARHTDIYCTQLCLPLSIEYRCKFRRTTHRR
jgi:hypothetical protein